ncbi:Hsp70 family protein [Pseudonocardia lacus]|uniref:Hsp70 family protein n=1 Tax=Pseudonocardia lacus TaxID=2835865 RepID=UPI0027E24189|nr:Hsp70 family protein [Pseudonocardia lacus]
MAGRLTVDFGIDLGTTNSAVAVMTPDAGPAVLRNNKRRELTPSAVYVDAGGALHVGDGARNRVERNPRDVATEFKLRMGVRDAVHEFPASGRRMTPEELSAEVLRSLVRDVRRELDEPLDAAVVTVPAAFELDQNEATVRAAGLAGIGPVTLIQEPSAAAWAYGHSSRDAEGFWLVYDFGGGTFDAAVVRVEDGEFVVVNHEGDNFLGGKLVDWALAEDVLLPALVLDHEGFDGVGRGDPRWAGVVAKLKLAAEQAKIDLSDVDSVEVDLELDGDAGRVDFSCRVTRDDVERALAPLYARSVNLCRKALADQGLRPADLDRVLLVGGTTLMPGVRRRLADPDEGLGVRLDHSLDPVTVVARGAAIFAGTRRVESGAPVAPRAPGDVAVQLEFEPVGVDTDPFVAGRLHAPGVDDWTGHTVEFVDDGARPPWRSGVLPVDATGAFATRLRAGERVLSTFSLVVARADGTVLPAAPDVLTYRHEPGAVGRGTAASHSLGVALADNQVSRLIAKGTELPASSPRTVLRTTVGIDKATGSGLLRVPIVQGERARANRNTTVGALELRPTDVRHDLRPGSEVEVLLRMDASQRIEVTAYIPLLDEEFPIAIDLGRDALGGVRLGRAAAEVVERHAELARRARDLGADAAGRTLARLDEEDAVHDIERLAFAAMADPDAEQTAWSRIRDTLAVLDDVEEQLDADDRAAEFRASVARAREMASTSGTAEERGEVDAAAAEGERAIERGDPTALADQAAAVSRLIGRLLDRTGQLDSARFSYFASVLVDDPDPGIQELLRRGWVAVSREDTDQLREIVRHLDRRRPGLMRRAAEGPSESGSTVGRG